MSFRVEANVGRGALMHRAESPRSQRFSSGVAEKRRIEVDSSQNTKNSLQSDLSPNAPQHVQIRDDFSGEFRSPVISILPNELMARVDKGHLNVRVPMRGGSRIGDGIKGVRVLPNTYAQVEFAVTNNQVDTERTRITFWSEKKDEDGNTIAEATSLDGFWWMDPEAFYIEDGRIMADVPCWPDQDITETVLGEGNTRVPRDPNTFMSMIILQGGMPPAVNLTGTASLGPDGITTTPPPEVLPLAEVDEQLRKALNFLGVSYEFSGNFRKGPLSLGEHARLNLEAGSQVTIKGSVGGAKATLNAGMSSFEMYDGESEVHVGAGRVDLKIDYGQSGGGMQATMQTQVSSFEMKNGESLVKAGAGSMDLKINTRGAEVGSSAQTTELRLGKFDLQDLRIQMPVGAERHELSLARLHVEGSSFDSPTFRFGPHGIHVDISQREGVHIEDLAGKIILKGADGELSTFRFGDRVSGEAELNLHARIRMDSAKRSLRVTGDIQNANASLSALQLVDGEDFNFAVDGAIFVGSGTFDFDSEAGESRFQLHADPDDPIVATVDVRDAQLGHSGSGALSAELSTDTHGRLNIDFLDIQSGERPVFGASGEIAVGIDSLEIPMMNGQKVEVEPGSHGVLKIQEMAYAPGDASPSIRARLVLDLGLNFALDSSMISGMEGVEAELDTETGRTQLLIDAQVSPEGEVILAGDLRLNGAILRAQRVQGGLLAPELGLQKRPLKKRAPLTMAKMRQLPAATANEMVYKTAPLQEPTLPQVELNPAHLIGALGHGNFEFDPWLKAISEQVSARTFSQPYLPDIRYSIPSISRPPGALHIEAKVVNDALQALTIDFRKSLDVRVHVGRIGVFDVSGEIRAEVKGIEVVQNPWTQKLDVEMDIEWSGLGLGAVPDWAIDRIESRLRDVALEKILGSSDLPSDLSTLMHQMQEHFGFLKTRTFDLAAGVEKDCEDLSLSSDKIDLAASRFSLRDVRVPQGESTRLELGDGQYIVLAPGTELEATGTGESLSLRGHVKIIESNLGAEDLGATLRGAEADLEMSVDLSHGGPKLSIDLSALTAEHLSGRTQLGEGAGAPHFDFETDGTIEGAALHLDYVCGLRPKLELDLPDVRARLKGEGAGRDGEVSARARGLFGEINGSIRIHDRDVLAELRSVDIEARGLGLRDASDEAYAGNLRVKAGVRDREHAGEVAVSIESVDGHLSLNRRSVASHLEVDGDVLLPNGSQFALERGSVRSLNWSLDDEHEVVLKGLSAEMSGVLSTQIATRTSPVTVDVRRAHLKGDLRIGADGLNGGDALRLEHLDASISNLHLPMGTKDFELEFEQIDVAGTYAMRIDGDGGVALFSDGPQRHADGGFMTRGRARRLHFDSGSPGLNVDLLGAQFELDLRRLAFGPEGTEMTLEGGRFDGELKRGRINIGKKGDLIDGADFAAGTLVQGEINHLRIATDREFALDATVRAEGGFREVERRRSHTVKGRFVHNALSVAGRARLALRVISNGQDKSGVSIRLGIDAPSDPNTPSLHWEGRTMLEPKELEVLDVSRPKATKNTILSASPL